MQGLWAKNENMRATIMGLRKHLCNGAVSQLPTIWYEVAHYNPFFFVIDGFRYGLLGQHEASITRGVLIMLIVNIGLFVVTLKMIRSGYKIKS